MTHLRDETRARSVRDMFARIAPRYDIMNRVMTAGQDVRWRREVIRRAELRLGDRVLDLGAGTGDLTREALRQCPTCRPLAADFTIEIMRVGQQRFAHPLDWSVADALRLPFPDESFDAVVSGFLLRNAIDLHRALREQYRVLRSPDPASGKPDGRWVALDTTRPRRTVLSPFIRFHMHRVIPTLGRLLTGQGDAYNYLSDSTERFLSAEELAEHLTQAGFQGVGFRRRMFGTIAIHWGKK